MIQTYQKIAVKSPFSLCDFADLKQLRSFGKNIFKRAKGEEDAHLLSIMKQLTLDEQAELFTDSDIISILEMICASGWLSLIHI